MESLVLCVVSGTHRDWWSLSLGDKGKPLDPIAPEPASYLAVWTHLRVSGAGTQMSLLLAQVGWCSLSHIEGSWLPHDKHSYSKQRKLEMSLCLFCSFVHVSAALDWVCPGLTCPKCSSWRLLTTPILPAFFSHFLQWTHDSTYSWATKFLNLLTGLWSSESPQFLRQCVSLKKLQFFPQLKSLPFFPLSLLAFRASFLWPSRHFPLHSSTFLQS